MIHEHLSRWAILRKIQRGEIKVFSLAGVEILRARQRIQHGAKQKQLELSRRYPEKKT